MIQIYIRVYMYVVPLPRKPPNSFPPYCRLLIVILLLLLLLSSSQLLIRIYTNAQIIQGNDS